MSIARRLILVRARHVIELEGSASHPLGQSAYSRPIHLLDTPAALSRFTQCSSSIKPQNAVVRKRAQSFLSLCDLVPNLSSRLSRAETIPHSSTEAPKSTTATSHTSRKPTQRRGQPNPLDVAADESSSQYAPEILQSPGVLMSMELTSDGGYYYPGGC